MIYPTYDNVFVVDAKKETTTKSGIILNESVDTGVDPVVIVAIGPDAEQEYKDFLGRKAHINRKNLVPVTVDGVPGGLITSYDILAILDDS